MAPVYYLAGEIDDNLMQADLSGRPVELPAVVP
jgi:hypothetical protein